MIRALALIIPALFLFPSCTFTYGNKEIADPARAAQIHPGASTKHDVFTQFGQPSDVVKVNDERTQWVYRYREAKNNVLASLPLYGLNWIIGGRNGDLCTRYLVFDQQGLLSNNTYNQEPFYTSNFFSFGRTMSNGFVTKESQTRTQTEMEVLKKPFDKEKAEENQLLERAL